MELVYWQKNLWQENQTFTHHLWKLLWHQDSGSSLSPTHAKDPPSHWGTPHSWPWSHNPHNSCLCGWCRGWWGQRWTWDCRCPGTVWWRTPRETWSQKAVPWSRRSGSSQTLCTSDTSTDDLKDKISNNNHPWQVNFQFSDSATIPNKACPQVVDIGKTPRYWGLAAK